MNADSRAPALFQLRGGGDRKVRTSHLLVKKGVKMLTRRLRARVLGGNVVTWPYLRAEKCGSRSVALCPVQAPGEYKGGSGIGGQVAVLAAGFRAQQGQ